MTSRIEEVFFGYSIVHCTLERNDRIVFILKEEVTEEMEKKGHIPGDDVLATMAVLFEPTVWKSKGNFAGYRWRGGIRNAFAAIDDINRSGNVVICGISGGGQAAEFSVANDSEWYSKEGKWVELPFKNKAMLTATNIDGEVYFAGRLRKLFKRTGKNKWIDLTEEDKHENLFLDLKSAKAQGRKPITMPMGFHAIDGFSCNDIYCGGHQSDLWHFNGEQWRRLAPPVNFDMECIVCAGDGNVYIGGAMGRLIRGRFDPETGHEQWEEIKTPLSGSESRFTSLAWFQNRLYLGNDWALYHLTAEDKVEKVAFPKGGATQYSFQYVTACDTALLSYGPHQALVFDGEKWEQIVGVIEIPQ